MGNDGYRTSNDQPTGHFTVFGTGTIFDGYAGAVGPGSSIIYQDDYCTSIIWIY